MKKKPWNDGAEPPIGTCTECGYLGYIVERGHTAKWAVRQVCRGCAAEAEAKAAMPARKPPKREVARAGKVRSKRA